MNWELVTFPMVPSNKMSNNEHDLYWLVIAVCIICYCTLVYLLIANVWNRKMLLRNTPLIARKNTNRCLWCMFLLHIFGLVVDTTMIWRHVNVNSKTLCKALSICLLCSLLISKTLVF